ncbi:MAG: ferrous iron transport protein B [Myxococcales bacterium]|nr:ferrous iron transport protein B [Myxococcales bacterium]
MSPPDAPSSPPAIAADSPASAAGAAVAPLGAPLVALVGNPNVGKTTLFNALTGSFAKVSNYPGITVERRSGVHRAGGRALEILDVPGTYSLVARSAEEQLAIDSIVGLGGQPRPELVVLCVDATQLSRSLYLLLQCQELGARCMVALTMVEEAGASAPDPKKLSAILGCPVVATDARRGRGAEVLGQAMVDALQAPSAPVWRWTPSPSLQESMQKVRAKLPEGWPQNDGMALWALSSVDDEHELAHIPEALRREVSACKLDQALDDEPVLGRWRFLDDQVSRATVGQPDRSRTERIDRVLLHRGLGFAAFLGVMFVIFMSLFAWSEPAIGAVEAIFELAKDGARGVLGQGVFADFITDGVIAGVGAVLVFLPQILLLFLFLGFLEDCGYLARVAYLMDRIMRTMNLHGRAFVPMLSGFACAVPAVMATRTMERRRDRILTMMVVPLMTCSARLPVYTLVIAALIPASHTVQGLLMVGMYAFSVVTSLIAALVLSRVMRPLRAKRLPFFIELPPYRFPRMRGVLLMMWQRSSMFLREAGTVILVCSMALWALLYFPRHLPKSAPDYDAMIAVAPEAERPALENAKASALLLGSYGGRLGHAIEPAIEPLGFDWKIGVGLIGAFAAREVFVSTMGIVYSVGGEADETDTGLRQALRDERTAEGKPAYPPLVGLSLMIFFALACQCMSTLAVVKRETGGYRWPAFLFAYMTGLAWVVTFVVYQGGRLLGF